MKFSFLHLDSSSCKSTSPVWPWVELKVMQSLLGTYVYPVLLVVFFISYSWDYPKAREGQGVSKFFFPFTLATNVTVYLFVCGTFSWKRLQHYFHSDVICTYMKHKMGGMEWVRLGTWKFWAFHPCLLASLYSCTWP